MRCILKVEAAGFADGLDLVAEGERIIKIFQLNGGPFPGWERLGVTVADWGEYQESVTNNSKGTTASKDTCQVDVMEMGFNAEEVAEPMQGVNVGSEKR